jgi:hypothetical protein
VTFRGLKRLYRWGTVCTSAGCSVAGRVAFPAPSSTLAVTGRVLEVFPCSSPLALPRASQAARPGRPGFFPRGLAPLLQSAPHLRWNSSQPPKRFEFLLSWDSSACRPSAVRPAARPLPEAEASFGSAVLPVDSCSARVVSHHLGGLLRAAAAGLLHPAAGSGVRRVSRSGFQATRRLPAGRRGPRAADRTLRRVPLANSRTASLRPLPSCHCRAHSAPDRVAVPPRRVGVGSGQPATEVAGLAPKGRITTDRGRCDLHVHRGGRGDEVPLRCSGDAPIRRSGPPRHQTDVRADRRTGLPVPSQHLDRPEGRCATCRGRPRSTGREPERAAEAVRRDLPRIRPGGSSTGARCRALASGPACWRG